MHEGWAVETIACEVGEVGCHLCCWSFFFLFEEIVALEC